VDLFELLPRRGRHNIYTVAQLPAEWWNRMALICEHPGTFLHRGHLNQTWHWIRPWQAWHLSAMRYRAFRAGCGGRGAGLRDLESDLLPVIIHTTPLRHGAWAASKQHRAREGLSSASCAIRPGAHRARGRTRAPRRQTMKLGKADPKGLLECSCNLHQLWRNDSATVCSSSAATRRGARAEGNRRAKGSPD